MNDLGGGARFRMAVVCPIGIDGGPFPEKRLKGDWG